MSTCQCDIGVAFDRDIVVVVEENEFAEFMRTRKRTCLIRNTFLKASVAAKSIGIVVDDREALAVEFRGEMRFGYRHADGVCDALSERTRGRLDALGVTVFGMTGGLTSELAEVLKIFYREPEPIEIEERVVEHGSMSRGEDKAVAIVPLWIFVVEFQEILPECVGDGGGAEGEPRMSRICFLDCFRRENADRVDGRLFHDYLLLIYCFLFFFIVLCHT